MDPDEEELETEKVLQARQTKEVQKNWKKIFGKNKKNNFREKNFLFSLREVISKKLINLK